MRIVAAFIAAIFPACMPAQGIIGTYAGSAHVFTDDGIYAAAAQLISPGAVAIDTQGNVFIADGGVNLVFQVGADGVLHTVAGNGQNGFSGDGGPALQASLSNPTGIAVDAQGNLYIGDTGNNRVRMVSPDGTITTVAGTGALGFSGDGGPAVQATFNDPYSVAVDGSGNLYIADRFNNRVRLVDPTGTISTVAGTGLNGDPGDGGPGTQATLNVPSAICLDGNGNLYITDQYHQLVRRLAPDGTIISVAGNGLTGFAGDGLSALNARFNLPAGCAVDASGNLFISDSINARVRMVDASGTITTVAGSGISNFGGDGGPAAQAMLARPLGLAVDSSGNVFIADYENARVRILSPDSLINTFAGTGVNVGDGGPATAARLSQPSAVAADAAGNVYIADSNQQRVRMVAPDGTISTVAGNGHRGIGGDGGSATEAYLSFPEALAVGPGGQVYIADTANGLIRVVDPASGYISTLAGGGCCNGDGGPATGAVLNAPNSIVADAAGNVYFVSGVIPQGSAPAGVSVRAVLPDGTITTVAGNGQIGFDGDGGPALQATLSSGIKLGLDAAGNLLIADTNNNRVRRVDSTGMIATIAGNGSGANSGDGGPAAAAGIGGPWGLASDASGNLYISAQNAIRKVAPDGTISTYAGPRYGYAGDGGPATAAALAGPQGLAVDAAGNLYIADYNNDRIRVVSPQ